MDSSRHPKILLRAVRITLQNYCVGIIVALALFLIFIPWWIQWCLLYVGGTLFVSSIVAQFVDTWRPKPRVSTHGKAVFISGCDSGFGHSLAQRLDDLGFHVFAGCLFPDKEGAQSLKKSGSERMHVLPLDVTSDESVQNAAKYVTENIGSNKLWAVVNNAGVNKGGEIAWTSMNLMQSIFEVNTFGVMRVTNAFIPRLCKDKGRIVTLASAAGRYSFPNMVPYCMTKQATISFCEGLRIELSRFEIKVITIEPWLYKTSLTHKDNLSSCLEKAWEESPDEIKELYPENYFERHKREAVDSLELSISDKPQEVVNCLEEAILAFDPKYAYMPGTFVSRISYWFFQRLPKPIVDFSIHDKCVTSLKEDS